MYKVKQYKTLRRIGLDTFGDILLFSRLSTQKSYRSRRTLNIAMKLSPKEKELILSGFSRIARAVKYQYRYLRKKSTRSSIKNKDYQDILLLTERRIDTFLLRIGIVNSYFQARQLVSHKKVSVNGVPIGTPGYVLSGGDLISVSALEYKTLVHFVTSENSLYRSWCNIPRYILFDYKHLFGIYLYNPTFLEVPFPVNVFN